MSFDTEFDYTSVVTNLNGYVTLYENQKANTLQQLSMLANIPSEYTNITTEQVNYHTTSLNCLNSSISKLSNVLSEITIVQNLPSNSKTALYDFYQTYVKNSSTSLGIDEEKNLIAITGAVPGIEKGLLFIRKTGEGKIKVGQVEKVELVEQVESAEKEECTW